MEKDRHLPLQGIPKSELQINKKSGLRIAVRGERRDLLPPVDTVPSGGKVEALGKVATYDVFVAHPDVPVEPQGY